MKFTTNRILLSSVAIVTLAIAAVLFISVRQSQRARDTADNVATTEEILRHLQKLELAAVDNQTAIRGYIITAKDSSRYPITLSAINIRQETELIKTHITDKEDKQFLEDSLVPVLDKSINFSNQFIFSGERNEPIAVLVATSQYNTNEIRRIGAKLQQQESELLEQRKRSNDRTISQLSTTLYWVLGITFLISIWIITKVRSNMFYIIQRKKKEEELRKSEERFRLLVSNIKDYAIFMLSTAGTIESWNNGAEKIKGYKANEIIGKNIDLFYTGEDIQKGEPRHALEMAAKNGHFEKEGWRVRKDGSVFWANVVITSMIDDKGAISGYAKITRDITERRKHEQQLEFLSHQLDQANDAIYVIGPDRMIKTWNKGAENLYGFTREEAIGKNSNDLLKSGITSQEVEDAMLQLETHEYWSGEFTRKNKSGKEIIIRSSSTTIRDESGRIAGFVSVNLDITEEKQIQGKLKQFNVELEAQVRQKTAEITAIFERITDAFIALDKDFRYVYINSKAGELIQRDPVAMIGRKATDEFPYILDTRLYKGMLHSMSSQQPVIVSEYYETIGLSLENYIYPAPDGLSVFIRDITARKKAEQEKQVLVEQMSTILNTLPARITLLDDKGVIVAVNDAWKHTGKGNGLVSTNYSIGTDYLDAIAHMKTAIVENSKNAGEGIRKVLNGRLPEFTMEYLFSAKENRWFRMIVTPLQKGGDTGAVIMHMDITEQKLSEEKIRLSEQKYKFLFDSNPMPMWMRSMDDAKIIDVNHAACEAYGYTREEFLALPLADLRHPDEIESFFKEFEEDISSPMNRGIWRHRKKDGNFVSVEIYVQDVIYNKRKARLILAKDVTERLKAEDQLRQSYQEIRRLVSHLQNIREEERTNMAREIHDQLGQQLTVMKMDISWLYKKLTEAEKPIRDRMQELKDIMDDTVKLVRRLSSDLRPSLLDDMGLLAAVEWHVGEMEKRSGISITLSGLTEEPSLPRVSKTNLFRIAQESLTNIARYAQARKVIVNMVREDNQLILTIKDDGIGFDQEKVAEKRTLGILGMRERTTMMGGTYEINSSPGHGTTVIVKIPVTPDQHSSKSK